MSVEHLPDSSIRTRGQYVRRETYEHVLAERIRYRSALDVLVQGIESGLGWPEHIGDVYKHCREALNDESPAE